MNELNLNRTPTPKGKTLARYEPASGARPSSGAAVHDGEEDLRTGGTVRTGVDHGFREAGAWRNFCSARARLRSFRAASTEPP